MPEITAMNRALSLPHLPALLPGATLALGLAGSAMALRQLPGLGALSPAILAILLGIGLRQVIGCPDTLRPGLGFAMRRLLRLAVVLLGLQVTLGQIGAMGVASLLGVAVGLLSCYFGTIWLGARLGVEPKLARLIATGTAVCGASAVIAANSVTRGKDSDVAYSLAAVTLLGTAAMLLQPALALLLHLGPDQAGWWLGASIHEVAQVVGAATQLGDDATRTATVAKMARILMLAPLVLSMAAFARRSPDSAAAEAKIPVPWFVFGFLALTALASLGVVPADTKLHAGQAAGWMLAAALGAMGFGIDLKELRRQGLRPLILALASWALILGASLAMSWIV